MKGVRCGLHVINSVWEERFGCFRISGKFSATIFNSTSINLSHNICSESKNHFFSYFKANMLSQNVPLAQRNGKSAFSTSFSLCLSSEPKCPSFIVHQIVIPKFQAIFRTYLFKATQHLLNVYTKQYYFWTITLNNSFYYFKRIALANYFKLLKQWIVRLWCTHWYIWCKTVMYNFFLFACFRNDKWFLIAARKRLSFLTVRDGDF